MEEKKERRTFDKEFKKEVVSLVTKKGRMVSEVARDLDIHPNVIHRWKREYLEDIEDESFEKGDILSNWVLEPFFQETLCAIQPIGQIMYDILL